MPRDFSKLEISMPRFDDREAFLKTLGTIVSDEIVAMIGREEQPDGSPQKQNSPAYATRKKLTKGYTTPLKGITPESPYLARRSTFKKDFMPPDSLLIHLNTKRAEIGRKLTDRGYWFMGITREAERKIKERATRYFRFKIKQMMEKHG